MKKVIPFLVILSSVFFTSCKYDLTPNGIYTRHLNELMQKLTMVEGIISRDSLNQRGIICL